jgi:hypothetical protein
VVPSISSTDSGTELANGSRPITGRSVQVDVNQERGQAAQHSQPDRASGWAGGQRPNAEQDGGGQGEQPEPVSC